MKRFLSAVTLASLLIVGVLHAGCATTAQKDTANTCLDAYVQVKCNAANIAPADQARCLTFVNNGKALFK